MKAPDDDCERCNGTGEIIDPVVEYLIPCPECYPHVDEREQMDTTAWKLERGPL